MNTRVHTLHSEHGHFFGFRQKNMSYVIGFPASEHAAQVRQYASNLSTIKLTMSKGTRNVSRIVSDGLASEYGIRDMKVGDIIINEQALLFIQKRVNINKAALQLRDMPLSEFLWMPFHNNVGVVMPTSLVADETHQLVWEAQVINPVNSPEFFQMRI